MARQPGSGKAKDISCLCQSRAESHGGNPLKTCVTRGKVSVHFLSGLKGRATPIRKDVGQRERLQCKLG